MKGAMPITISATFAVSPSPKAMKRIGSSAIGGITAMVVTNGPEGRARRRQDAQHQADEQRRERADAEPDARAARGSRTCPPRR